MNDKSVIQLIAGAIEDYLDENKGATSSELHVIIGETEKNDLENGDMNMFCILPEIDNNCVLCTFIDTDIVLGDMDSEITVKRIYEGV